MPKLLVFAVALDRELDEAVERHREDQQFKH